jgi:hypothetical protein
VKPAIVRAITASGLSIYDPLVDHPELFVDLATLERILNDALVGLALNYPLRTRSKVLKSRVCEALGYPVPPTFRRTKPRFVGQNLDTHVQKADNLQIWNERVSPSRRYALIRLNAHDVVTRVRIVTGNILARYDSTGTLTHKYQAKSQQEVTGSCLVSQSDTMHTKQAVRQRSTGRSHRRLPIRALYKRLLTLVGTALAGPGIERERSRGGLLHALVSCRLGTPDSHDSGQFPDIPEQLLEVKLQTRPTIDLGLVSPDSSDQIAENPEFCHRDVRYAVFYGIVRGAQVHLEHLVLTTGADFFNFFRRFGGRVRNAKIQIPLPRDFFD